MLKIKDNVTFEDLEKYDFYKTDNYHFVRELNNSYISFDDDIETSIVINLRTRELNVFVNNANDVKLEEDELDMIINIEVVYHLMNDGLLEVI